MAASGTRPQMFIEDVTADRVYRAILSAQIQPKPAKLIGQYLTANR